MADPVASTTEPVTRDVTCALETHANPIASKNTENRRDPIIDSFFNLQTTHPRDSETLRVVIGVKYTAKILVAKGKTAAPAAGLAGHLLACGISMRAPGGSIPHTC